MISIIQNKKECYVCKTTVELHKHHIIYGKNRKKADEDGCWCWLCAKHHNMSNDGVHYNKKLDNELKVLAEEKWCEYYNKTKEDFLKRYYINYLD